MKRLLALLLALTIVLCCAACGRNDGNGQTGEQSAGNNASNNDGKQDPIFGSDDISVEGLMNREPNPESDFLCEDLGDGVLVLTQYLGDDEIVVIPETWNGKPIEAIGSYVFSNSSPVKAVRMSDSIKSVDIAAFAINSNLEIAICGAGLEKIGDGVFQNCTSLRVLVLNDGLISLGAVSISGCSSLVSIEIPDSVTDFHPMTFYASPEGFTIIGSAGSAAEEFANSEGIAFQIK